MAFHLLIGLIIWAGVFALFVFMGRKERTTHGQSIIAWFGIVIGAVCCVIYWVVQAVFWLI